MTRLRDLLAGFGDYLTTPGRFTLSRNLADLTGAWMALGDRTISWYREHGTWTPLGLPDPFRRRRP